MQTQFKPTTTVNTSLMQLPIMKHFNETDISNNINKFRKGEKNLFWFLKLAAIGGIGYFVWKYVLPPVFQAIGHLMAVAATGVLIVLLIMLMPVIFKGLRWVTHYLHKAVIRQDPFGELDSQRKKMIEQQEVARAAKGKIDGLRNDMQTDAVKAEEDANKYQTKIITLQNKATILKTKLDEMRKQGGSEALDSDEYVEGNSELVKLLSEAQRVSNMHNQAKDFIQKYGSRAAIMKKFSQKMVMVEASMEIKIADFDASVEMLKKDYEFGQKARQATDAAKSAMLFTKSWELDYALDVVTSTIASDIALTAGNLRDIDTLTAQYSLDSDELYANLNTLADNIKVGNDVIPSAKQYNNPEYKLTESDKIKSGGFDGLF